MKKFSEQEWQEFQERVKQASLGENTIGVNLFRVDFKVWKQTSGVLINCLKKFKSLLYNR